MEVNDTTKISVLAIIPEFASGWMMDSSLAALSVRAGEPLGEEHLIELCSGAKTLFDLTTLASRGIDRVSDCRKHWADTLETFRKALAAWADVPLGEEPLLRFYLMQLGRLCDLAASRVDLFTISGSDRQAFVKRYKTDSPKAYTAKQTEGESDAEEERVKECLSLPIQ
jgi:hypothetical protein